MNGRKRASLGEIKRQSCCAPANEGKGGNGGTCCAGAGEKQAIAPNVTSDWTFKDRIGSIRCRLGSFREDYAVKPGLYSIGAPGKNSDVFVSANYKLSFDILRKNLKGMDAWILVLDTKGINVWCAAGKGTFGTDELVKRIKETGLENIVSHRRIIAPQLGAPGIKAHIVQKEAGFRVFYGPVEAFDIKKYVSNGYKAAPSMRNKKFNMLDRLVLTPMELRPALKYFFLYSITALIISGIGKDGLIWGRAIENGAPLLALGMIALFAGALFTPMLLPFLPFRSFSVKGFIAGLFATALALRSFGVSAAQEPFFTLFAILFFPAVSSYLALQFTGSTTFTSPSGVRKELKYAAPLYGVALIVSLAAFAAHKLLEAI